VRIDKTDYGGMTTNERLYVAGFLERFDTATRSHDREKMIQILMRVNISNEGATAIVDKILAVGSKNSSDVANVIEWHRVKPTLLFGPVWSKISSAPAEVDDRQ
jgi:hypothetical protein